MALAFIFCSMENCIWHTKLGSGHDNNKQHGFKDRVQTCFKKYEIIIICLRCVFLKIQTMNMQNIFHSKKFSHMLGHDWLQNELRCHKIMLICTGLNLKLKVETAPL